MSIQVDDLAPDFEADSTQGRIRFCEWLGNDWGVFSSHPKGFHRRAPGQRRRGSIRAPGRPAGARALPARRAAA